MNYNANASWWPALLAACLLLGACGQPLELMTEDEYAAIADYPDVVEIPRATPEPGAPVIEVLKPSSKSVKTPFDIQIVFKPSDDAEIVAETARVVYVKGLFRKDLTELIREHATLDESGIYGERAAIPAGSHRFSVEVTDSMGRLGEAQFKVRVTK